ncbi:MAG: hypothetical protein ACTSQO_06610 [Candidatus Helarchaeota archaeon]
MVILRRKNDPDKLIDIINNAIDYFRKIEKSSEKMLLNAKMWFKDKNYQEKEYIIIHHLFEFYKKNKNDEKSLNMNINLF